MIKNVIFDFGQVLVRFDPIYMTSKYVKNKDDIKTVADVVFDRLYWDKLDKGTIEDEQVIAAAKSRLPEHLHKAAEATYYNWIYNIPEIDGMRALVRRLKEEKCVRIFVLSDISRYFAQHADEIPILSYVDGCVFSAVCGFVKPSREIFEHLCLKHGIDPCESVFIDDKPCNVAGAEMLGMKGYVFDGDAQRLERFLHGIL